MERKKKPTPVSPGELLWLLLIMYVLSNSHCPQQFNAFCSNWLHWSQQQWDVNRFCCKCINREEQKCTCSAADGFDPQQITPQPLAVYNYNKSILLILHMFQHHFQNGVFCTVLVFQTWWMNSSHWRGFSNAKFESRTDLAEASAI